MLSQECNGSRYTEPWWLRGLIDAKYRVLSLRSEIYVGSNPVTVSLLTIPLPYAVYVQIDESLTCSLYGC